MEHVQNHNPVKVVLPLGVLCLGLLYMALLTSGMSKPILPPLVAKENIEYWLYNAPSNVTGKISLQYREELDKIYRQNGFQTIWMDNFELSDAGQALVRSLRHTASDEWKAYRYRISKLETEISRLTNQPANATAIDVLLTDAYIDYAQQVLNNELLPNTGELDHPSFKKVASPPITRVTSLDVISVLSQSLDQRKLQTLINRMAPSHIGYEQLATELDRYQAIVDSGRWYPLEITPPLSEGGVHAQVPRLRWMLKAYGDFHTSKLAWLMPSTPEEDPLLLEQSYRLGDSNPAYILDHETITALGHFQHRHGLEVTKVLDATTKKRLNVPPYFMAQRIALNMKRWRYLPKSLGERYILVNMANYRLDLIEDGKSKLNMKVIIGKSRRRTPVLAETISTVVIAPKWNVPHRIAIRDILPVAKRNPNYLETHKFKIYQGWQKPAVEVSLENIDWEGFHNRANTYRLVQGPGEDNSLGNVKFVFPNDKSIYLHDTNHRELFSEDMRALSSGCIRVEKPLELASSLLKSQRWNTTRIQYYIDNANSKHVTLKDPVPVYLMYWTTWVSSEGALQVREDIYQRDQINSESHKLDSIIL